MATVTYNFTTAQTNRIQEATAAYNAINGTSLNSKQWGLVILKEAVRAYIEAKESNEAIAATQAALNADLAGNA